MSAGSVGLFGGVFDFVQTLSQTGFQAGSGVFVNEFGSGGAVQLLERFGQRSGGFFYVASGTGFPELANVRSKFAFGGKVAGASDFVLTQVFFSAFQIRHS